MSVFVFWGCFVVCFAWVLVVFGRCFAAGLLEGFWVCSWISVLFVCGVLRARAGWVVQILPPLPLSCVLFWGEGGSFIIIVFCNWRLREMCSSQVFFIHDAVRGVGG